MTNFTKAEMTKMLKEAKKRVPSKLMVQCNMCFSPRNTLTVKPHIESVWFKSEIKYSPGENFEGVDVPCKGCKHLRFLSLSEIGRSFFERDWKDYGSFVLLKDDKWNALVGLAKEDKSITFTEGGFPVKSEVKK